MINQFKTLILLATLSALFIVIGGYLGGEIGLTIALGFAILFNLFSYFFSDKIVLSMYRAKEITETDNPKLYNMVREVAIKAGIPMPRVYIIEEESPNAFATGRNPKHSAVAFTTGILRLLDERELKGVIAHEIAHIKNRDILISTISAIIVSAITYLVEMAKWAMIFRGSSNRENHNPILDILVILLAPIAAIIIQMAISRSREFLADETGAKIIRDPIALANALDKIQNYAYKVPLEANPSTSHLFIIPPILEGLFKLFSTHPPTEERIKRLKQLARELGVAY
ncbi:MAG: zinc metalloprotease HtpX [candidate division WOR-3 bacterium]|nr:zinc metalloprotease HtpX [candidate division WOR-3 bacterium]MDW8149868.1 zinc metalloprotease HtpX [candidate division WOR-3 bacterium]